MLRGLPPVFGVAARRCWWRRRTRRQRSLAEAHRPNPRAPVVSTLAVLAHAKYDVWVQRVDFRAEVVAKSLNAATARPVDQRRRAVSDALNVGIAAMRVADKSDARILLSRGEPDHHVEVVRDIGIERRVIRVLADETEIVLE